MTGTATAAATRRLGALARNALPCALHEELAGAGHMGPITHEAEFNARIEQFLVALAAPEIASRRKVAWDRWCRRASADAMLSSSAAEA